MKPLNYKMHAAIHQKLNQYGIQNRVHHMMSKDGVIDYMIIIWDTPTRILVTQDGYLITYEMPDTGRHPKWPAYYDDNCEIVYEGEDINKAIHAINLWPLIESHKFISYDC